MQHTQLQKILKEHQDTFTNEFGIEKLFLYGSYATSIQNEDSDLDLMYVMQKDTGMSLGRLGRIESLIQELTGIKKIELVNKKYINPVVYLNASKNQIELFWNTD